MSLELSIRPLKDNSSGLVARVCRIIYLFISLAAGEVRCKSEPVSSTPLEGSPCLVVVVGGCGWELVACRMYTPSVLKGVSEEIDEAPLTHSETMDKNTTAQ